jgi:hypothetical protein
MGKKLPELHFEHEVQKLLERAQYTPIAIDFVESSC